jgi:hypothetical protein
MLAGYRFVKDEQVPNQNYQVNYKPDNTETNKDKNEDKKVENNKDIEKAPVNKKDVFYQDENVVIKYVKSEEGPFGPVHKFEIENISDKPYTVIFTDLYIDGYKVFVSGLTCENILPGKKSIDDLVLLESEWGQFTEEPDELMFKIKLVNPKSYFTEYEIDQMTFNVED